MHLAETLEQVLVKAFVAEAADKALHEPVLLGPARRDVVPIDAATLLPAQMALEVSSVLLFETIIKVGRAEPDEPIELCYSARSDSSVASLSGKAPGASRSAVNILFTCNFASADKLLASTARIALS